MKNYTGEGTMEGNEVAEEEGKLSDWLNWRE